MNASEVTTWVLSALKARKGVSKSPLEEVRFLSDSKEAKTVSPVGRKTFIPPSCHNLTHRQSSAAQNFTGRSRSSITIGQKLTSYQTYFCSKVSGKFWLKIKKWKNRCLKTIIHSLVSGKKHCPRNCIVANKTVEEARDKSRLQLLKVSSLSWTKEVKRVQCCAAVEVKQITLFSTLWS